MNTPTARDLDLMSRWIEPNPQKSSLAEAWVLPRYVPIWAIIGQLELDGWRVEEVAEDYELPAEAVHAAIAYYRHHQQPIDERIARNRALFASA